MWNYEAQAVELRALLNQLWSTIKVLSALSLGTMLGPLQWQCVFSKLTASAQPLTDL